MFERKIKLSHTHSFFLFGPRQVGKSTLLAHRFDPKNCLMYDLLKSDEYLRLTANPEIFRHEVLARPKGVSTVIVDEVQRVPELLSEVHGLMASNVKIQFILTGSSARKLKRTDADLLAGRALTYHLYPLTYDELGERFSFLDALRFGTLPPIWQETEQEVKQDILRSYVDTYLREEIEREAVIRNMVSFARFLTLAASENGNVINYANIARETGTSAQTIKSYFQILEDTLLGFFLFPYVKSERKRLAKHPKFYFFDTGVVHALRNRVTVPIDLRTTEFGHVFEHFVILELMRQSRYKKTDWMFSFYRTSADVEVDLIIETPHGDLFAIEIKGTDRVSSVHLRGLRSFAKDYPHAKLFCLNLAEKRHVQGNVTVLHWRDFIENF